MVETVQKEKKKKVYKVATELNVSHETLIEFLRKKGHEVKSHMSVVNDDMMRDILIQFKKEKDVADRHNRKIQEIRETKKRAEKKEADQAEEKEEQPQEPAPVAAEEEKAPVEVKAEATPEQVPPKEEAEEAPEEAPPAVAESAEATDQVADEEAVPESEESGQQPAGKEVQSAKPSDPASPLARERKSLRGGLTIKGKLDLTPKKKPAAGTPGSSEEPHKKKKKKRKIREDAVAKSPETDDLDRKKKKGRRSRQAEVSQDEVKTAIRKTLAAMDDNSPSGRAVLRKKKKKEREEEERRVQEEAQREAGRLRVTEFLSVNELANLMRVNVADVIRKCMDLGIMVSINQRLEKDTITLVVDEFGFEAAFYDELEEDTLIQDIEDAPEDLKPRPPVVTIMGHVDHGKTSLLDYIRSANVVAGEAGGITQHIGAYEVTTASGNKVTFLDTPGHEAFTAMRARGAQITDIVVLVVSADDSVMPQTLEAISHAQAAAVPIIIGLNKIDKPDANPERIRQQLSEKNILVEEWGGKYQSVEISAKTGKNVDLLLEKIALESDLLDLKANPDRVAYGTIIEAQLDRGKGTTATVLVQTGTLRVGDPFIAGVHRGKVRAMFDERGNRVEEAGPSTPVQITGMDGIPQAGDVFAVVGADRDAREISIRRKQLKREQEYRQVRHKTLEEFSQQIQEGEVKELALIVKGDVDGSVEALSDSLMKIHHKEVKVNVIHSGVGMISESDVMLASTSGAVIIGFRVRPNLNARRLAEREEVDIRSYTIIYDATKDIHSALEGMLSPERKEEIMGTAVVREVFKIPKIGLIAGSYVQDGKITRNSKGRLVRDGIQIYEGVFNSLKRFKEDAKEVESGFECGIGFEGYNDIKVGDVIEAFKIVESKRKLSL
ncbi:MAG: translation initiation factor IF-2 [Ignavibacteria bacterium]|nr:translation initiation factor IF-2 [Ignavibacteria bacterium]